MNRGMQIDNWNLILQKMISEMEDDNEDGEFDGVIELLSEAQEELSLNS